MDVKDVKRLKFLEDLVIAKSNEKLILTKPKSKKHVTVMDRENSFDVHITEQSTPKKYVSVFLKDKKEILNRFREIIGNAEVDIDGPVFHGCTLAILPNDVGKKLPETFPKGKNVEITQEKLYELEKDFSEKYPVPNGNFPVERDILNSLWVIWHLWPDSSNSKGFENIFIKPQDAVKTNFTKAFVINQDQKLIGSLFKRFGKFYFFSSGTFKKMTDENFEGLGSKIDEALKS